MCVSCSLTFRLETKIPWWTMMPSRRKKTVVFTNVTANTYQGRMNAGLSKVCEMFKVRGIESLKYICYCGDISTPQKRGWTKNCDWLFVMSVKWPHGRALTNECSHIFQPFSRQSTRDYALSDLFIAKGKAYLMLIDLQDPCLVAFIYLNLETNKSDFLIVMLPLIVFRCCFFVFAIISIWYTVEITVTNLLSSSVLYYV